MTNDDKPGMPSSIVINGMSNAIVGSQVASTLDASHRILQRDPPQEFDMKYFSSLNIPGILAGVGLVAGLVSGLVPMSAEAGGLRTTHANTAGGVTSTAMVGRQGASGGAYARGRSVATDGHGNGTAVSGAGFVGPNGATGGRAGTTTVYADGSATHQSGLSASGAQGSVQSSGSATRDAAGNVTQSRSSAATNTATGNSVQSSSAYNSTTGLTHTATCYNASGAVIACR